MQPCTYFVGFFLTQKSSFHQNALKNLQNQRFGKEILLQIKYNLMLWKPCVVFSHKKQLPGYRSKKDFCQRKKVVKVHKSK